MTYCVGVLSEDGLVFAADTRTNAGVDHISTVRKLTVFEKPGDRVFVLMSAGNLAITQTVVSLLEEGCKEGERTANLMTAPTMFRAARLVGDALREVNRIDGEHLAQRNVGFNAAFILGGQIKGERPRVFQVYDAGNFIEATAEMPFLQIGETKYGKPVLDRLLGSARSLAEIAKCVLVSFTPTIRSNVSVGLPIDLVCYRRDSLRANCQISIDADDPYFETLADGWAEGLSRVFQSLPDPELDP